MGRGNVCVDGPYEGLFYIDGDYLNVYRKDGESPEDEPETILQCDLFRSGMDTESWSLDEVGSIYEVEDILNCFYDEFHRTCPSFVPASKNVYLKSNRRAVYENELFYICTEDNDWGLAVELIQKDGYSDCQCAWLAGLQRTHYRKYLDGMRNALLSRLPEIGFYTGPLTHGTITREEKKHV